MSRRKATHAGSWYTDDEGKLDAQLSHWLRDAGDVTVPNPRAVIGPHAGFSYSGPTAAYAYKQIDPEGVQRVFVLGPSHCIYLSSCALTTRSVYETPIGNLNVDTDIVASLHETKLFEKMNKKAEEDEHSLEMHLPFIAKVMSGHPVKIIPILVGSLDAEAEAVYGEVLAPYLDDPSNLFVVSSDFCHWGDRFQYTYTESGHEKIYQSIEAVDKRGMALIEEQNTKGFKEYLHKTKNTICGRHPIAVLMHALEGLDERRKTVKFLHYAQSSQCLRKSDSSVSYASAAITIT
eukprot:m.152493 g.152493  ORF g.152493 m.152493 type:complete len:291 (+) comp13302_c1_seq4:131-1003(+)